MSKYLKTQLEIQKQVTLETKNKLALDVMNVMESLYVDVVTNEDNYYNRAIDDAIIGIKKKWAKDEVKNGKE